jgi:hypothetical protein
MFHLIERSGLDVDEKTSSPHSRLGYIHRFLLADLISACRRLCAPRLSSRADDEILMTIDGSSRCVQDQ